MPAAGALFLFDIAMSRIKTVSNNKNKKNFSFYRWAAFAYIKSKTFCLM